MTPPGRIGTAHILVVTFTKEEHEAADRVFAPIAPYASPTQLTGPPNNYWVALTPAGQPVTNVVLVRAGRGNGDAQATVAEAIQDFLPSFVLTCGTAGSRSDRALQLGDIVLGEFVEYYEFAKVLPPAAKVRPPLRRILSAALLRRPPEPGHWRVKRRHLPYDHPSLFLYRTIGLVVKQQASWRPHLQARRPDGGVWPSVETGMLLSGEKILSAHDSHEQGELLEQYDKALGVDTESYGVANAVHRQRHRKTTFSHHYNPLYLPIRAVSDLVDTPTAEADRKAWTNYAAEAACAFARALCEQMVQHLPTGSAVPAATPPLATPAGAP